MSHAPTVAHTIAALVRSAKHKEAQLLAELHAVEKRLGTPFEKRGDLRRARRIAHRLISLATVTRPPAAP